MAPTGKLGLDMRHRLSLPLLLGILASIDQAHGVKPLDACYQASATRAEVGDCLDRRRQTAEAALEKAVMAANAMAADIGKVTGRPEIAAEFEESEREFREFVDRHCAWIGAMAIGGSGSGDLIQDCAIRLTEQHTADLSAQVSARNSGPGVASTRARRDMQAVVIPPGDWRLIYLERDGQRIVLPADPEVTLAFDNNGMAAGRSFVNRYFGRATVAASGRLSWADALGSTRMAGPAELMDLEQAYLKALGRTGRWQVVGETLTLDSDDGAILMRFAR